MAEQQQLERLRNEVAALRAELGLETEAAAAPAAPPRRLLKNYDKYFPGSGDISESEYQQVRRWQQLERDRRRSN